jgi:hypothetical protein
VYEIPRRADPLRVGPSSSLGSCHRKVIKNVALGAMTVFAGSDPRHPLGDEDRMSAEALDLHIV